MPLMTGSQSYALNGLADWLGGQVGQYGPQYQGQFTPGMTPLALDWINDVKGMEQDPMWQGASTFLQGALKPYDSGAAMDYWSNAIKTPALSAFDDVTAQISEEFGGAGALDSGAFANAMGDASKDLSTNLGASLAQILYQDRGDYMNRGMTAAGMSGSMAQTLANVLKEPAMFEYQDKATDLGMRYQDWLQSLPNSQMAKLAGLFGTTFGAKPYENVITQSSQPGILGELIKGASQIGSAYMTGGSSLLPGLLSALGK